MSKSSHSQSVQKATNGNYVNSMPASSTNILPLQIQPKPTGNILPTNNQPRIMQSQPTFTVQGNNQYLANIQPNFSHSNNNNNRTQTFNMAPNNTFTFTLAPIQAKPAENTNNNSSIIASNFPPIQMRPNSNTPKQQPVTMPTTSANMSSAAAGGYYRDWILEAIDKLRERKARPDAERISTLMKRYHNIPLEDTVMCLNKLADTGSVVCVDYKGNISYRNPYKWRKNSANGGGIMNPPSVTNRILEAFRHLDKTRNLEIAGAQKNGYSIAEIELALTSTQTTNPVELTKTQLRNCLEREAAYGKLMRRSDCTYIIDENGEKKMRKAAAIQAKKTALAHKPIPNKSITAAQHPITIAASTPILTTIPNNINNSFTTFSVQSIQPYVPQIAQFVTQNERQILPMLTTSTPYATVPFTSISQPSVILPKQNTIQMPILKCEPTSPTKYEPNTTLKHNIPQLDLENEQTDDKSYSINSVQPNSTSSVTFTSAMAMDRKSAKVNRRGRPPGSKNKRYQPESENNISNQVNKKPRTNSENQGTSTYSGSSCSVASISNSDQTVPATGSVNELCSECKGPQTEYDKFLCCKDCIFKVHPSCLHYWPELTERARLSEWQCSLCKTCSICNDRGSKESVYICDGCDKGFHPECHLPKIEEPVSSNSAWICSTCHNEGFRIKSEELDDSVTENITTCKSELKIDHKGFSDQTNLNSKNEDDKTKVVDVSKWTVDEVCDWLTLEGFGLQSGSFREQEIDGACLLLMKRIDVLTELNIKLGPAVKIYERIKHIQNDGSIWRCDDCF